MTDKTINHSLVAAHELSEHAAVLVLGTEAQAELMMAANGLQALLSVIDGAGDINLAPLLKKNLLSAAAILVEHVRGLASGAGFHAHSIPPDEAGDVLDYVENLRGAF